MKTERNIFIAFILNLGFSIFEVIGGIFTGSVAIISDAVHDMGDALSIGISFFLEKKSHRAPDATYTYGYARFSAMGSVITTVILALGSAAVIYNAILRIISPTQIKYNGMIIFAVIGVAVNLIAAYFTREGDSLNQRAVNLHMLEDVLGWIVVLIGAVIMRFTDISIIDPVLSIAVAAFILINALKNLKEVLDLFLEKAPSNIDIEEIKKHLSEIEGVLDVHHIHLWSQDGSNVFATMHIVAKDVSHALKHSIKDELKAHGIVHSTLEFETPDEHCHEESCVIEQSTHSHHHHHHH